MARKAAIHPRPDKMFDHIQWRYFTAEDGTFQIWTDRLVGFGVERGSFAAILMAANGTTQLDRRYCSTRKEAKDRCWKWNLERSPKREERTAYVIQELP